jgi:hypothetical protein
MYYYLNLILLNALSADKYKCKIQQDLLLKVVLYEIKSVVYSVLQYDIGFYVFVTLCCSM